MSTLAQLLDDEEESPADILRAHLRALARYTAGMLAMAFVVGSIAGWSGMFAFLFAIFGLIPMALIFLGVGILHSVQGVREAFRVALPTPVRITLCAAAPLAMGVIILLSVPAAGLGNLAATYIRLAIRYSVYQTIVDRARHGQADDRAPFQSVRYQIDPGPPVRVAFDGDGILDNWSGIVFDPTGDVLQADGFDAAGKFHAPDRVTRLFGGDLVSCRRLWRDYYQCSFT